MKALITNIQRFSVHDGTGIRTLIFFKGCPLQCVWCSNPETQDAGIQIMQTSANCLHCYKCIESCPKNALELKNGIIIANKNKCNLCGICKDVCPTKNIDIIGKYYSINELIDIIRRDEIFYYRTNGGITYSGGEPAMQLDFLIKLSKKLKQININIAIETCGYFNFEDFKNLLPYLDVIYFDLKIIDDVLHKKFTGKPNRLIIENLKKLIESFNNIIIRLPLIPGYTDDDKNIKDIVDILKHIGINRIDILPYHAMGLKKYAWLGLNYKLKDLAPFAAQKKADRVKKIFQKEGLVSIIGG